MYLDVSSLWCLREKSPLTFMVSIKQSNKKLWNIQRAFLSFVHIPMILQGLSGLGLSNILNPLKALDFALRNMHF